MSSTKKPRKLGSRAAAFNDAAEVPPMFAHTLKDTQKLGTKKFASKNKYIKKDIEIGSGIVGKDGDLEGLGDVIKTVKKEGGHVPAGAIRKHRMVKQLSGRFTNDDLKEEAMAIQKKKLEEKKLSGLGANRSKLISPIGAGRTKLTSPLGRNRTGKDKVPRKKIDIFAMMDDAIESGPTEEARLKAAAEKAAAEAPIPKAVVPAWKARLKMQGKEIKDPESEQKSKPEPLPEPEAKSPPQPEAKPSPEPEQMQQMGPETEKTQAPGTDEEKSKEGRSKRRKSKLLELKSGAEGEPLAEVTEKEPDTQQKFDPGLMDNETQKEKIEESKYKSGKEKSSRKKLDIFSVLDDAIESGPTEEARLKAAAEKAAADAPIPKAVMPAWKARLKMQGKEIDEPEQEAAVESEPQSSSKIVPEPEAESETKPEPEPETKLEPEPESETKPEFEPEPEPEPKPEPTLGTKLKPGLEPAPKLETKLEPEPEPEPKLETRPEQTRGTESNHESEPETKSRSDLGQMAKNEAESTDGVKPDAEQVPTSENGVVQKVESDVSTPEKELEGTAPVKPKQHSQSGSEDVKIDPATTGPEKRTEDSVSISLSSSDSDGVSVHLAENLEPVAKLEPVMPLKKGDDLDSNSSDSSSSSDSSDSSSSSDSSDSSAEGEAENAVEVPAQIPAIPSKKGSESSSESDDASIPPSSPVKTVNFVKTSKKKDETLDEITALASPSGSTQGFSSSMNMSMVSMNSSKPGLFDSLGSLFDLETVEEADIVLDPKSPDFKQQLKAKIVETEKKIGKIAVSKSNALAEMQKYFSTAQMKLSTEFQKKIWRQRKINEKQEEEFQDALEDEKEIVESLRAENKRLRATKAKLPKQMKEVISSNKGLETANEEIAGHFKSLSAFVKKLEGDHERLSASSAQCRDEYLPRYRQELRERQQYITTETKIKNLYRDCMIKIAKQVEKSRSPGLIESVSQMVLETEAEINPKFNPRLLFKDDSSSSSDYSSSDDSSSSSDSD